MINHYPTGYLTLGENENEGSIVLFFNDDWEQIDNSLEVAAYEALIVIEKDTAENIYADANKYGVKLFGNAMAGKIAVLDLRGQTDTFTELPADDKLIIYTSSVDTYIGED